MSSKEQFRDALKNERAKVRKLTDENKKLNETLKEIELKIEFKINDMIYSALHKKKWYQFWK